MSSLALNFIILFKFQRSHQSVFHIIPNSDTTLIEIISFKAFDFTTSKTSKKCFQL